MRKPNSSEVKSGEHRSYTPPEVGGHYMELLNVEPYKSKKGAEMLKVSFDFADNDKQPQYFKEAYNNDTRANKSWSFQATKYIGIMDYSDTDKYSRGFMSFINAIEKSNTGFETNWEKDGMDFCSQFRNKKIGGVFGLVETEYNGKRSKRAELRWFCSTDKVADASIPEPKLLPVEEEKPLDDFIELNTEMSDLPFN